MESTLPLCSPPKRGFCFEHKFSPRPLARCSAWISRRADSGAGDCLKEFESERIAKASFFVDGTAEAQIGGSGSLSSQRTAVLPLSTFREPGASVVKPDSRIENELFCLLSSRVQNWTNISGPGRAEATGMSGSAEYTEEKQNEMSSSKRFFIRLTLLSPALLREPSESVAYFKIIKLMSEMLPLNFPDGALSSTGFLSSWPTQKFS